MLAQSKWAHKLPEMKWAGKQPNLSCMTKDLIYFTISNYIMHSFVIVSLVSEKDISKK